MSTSSTRARSPERDSYPSGQNIQEADRDSSDLEVPAVASGSRKRRQHATKQGACVHCKSLKVRCEFIPGETRCKRCIAGNHQCAARDRKKRKPALTHEDLQARSKQQDEQLASLLRHLDRLKMENKIEAWVRRAQATQAVRQDGTLAPFVPVLTRHYYSALIGPLDIDTTPHNPDYMRLPIIMRAGILNSSEVLDLFNLFFERINPFFSLLDGELHCPQKLIWVNHFLFTVICTLACRHYLQRPGLYNVLMDIAQDAAGEALVSGLKTVETIQAFLQLAVYPVPRKRWSDDRSWLYMGAAIRLALELQLDKPSEGLDEQTRSNNVRTWINAYCVDGSYAIQFGKPTMVEPNDYLVRMVAKIWHKSPSSSPYDIGLCAYAETLLLMAQFCRACRLETHSHADKEELDLASLTAEYDKKFTELYAYWNRELGADPNISLCPVVRYRFHNYSFISAYLRLVILSQGFQYSVKQGITKESYILQQSLGAAQLALTTVIDKLFPSGFLGWAMESNFLYMAFCAAFLLNLLRPKFLPLLSSQQCVTIKILVQKLMKILASSDVALDGKHSPAIYSRFLSQLFDKYHTPILQQDVHNINLEIPAQHRAEREHSRLNPCSWPDTSSVVVTSDRKDIEMDIQCPNQEVYASHVVRQQAGEAQMDFSLQHFIRSANLDASEELLGMQDVGHFLPSQNPQEWYLQPDMESEFYPGQQ